MAILLEEVVEKMELRLLKIQDLFSEDPVWDGEVTKEDFIRLLFNFMLNQELENSRISV